MIEQKYSTF